MLFESTVSKGVGVSCCYPSCEVLWLSSVTVLPLSSIYFCEILMAWADRCCIFSWNSARNYPQCSLLLTPGWQTDCINTLWTIHQKVIWVGLIS